MNATAANCTAKRELESNLTNNIFRYQTKNQSRYGRNFINENQRQQTSSNFNQQNGNQHRQDGSKSSTSERRQLDYKLFCPSADKHSQQQISG